MSTELKNNVMLERLEGIVEKVSELTWCAGIEAFKISQKSTIGETALTVYGLTAEIADDELFILTDMQDKLMHNDISMFLLEQIKKVKASKNQNSHDVIIFEFLKGEKITIEALPGVSTPEEIYE